MIPVEMECPKCKGRMDVGFIADISRSAVLVSKWVKGLPEKSVWTITKTKGKDQFQVLTYRCCQCGYLESYAKEE